MNMKVEVDVKASTLLRALADRLDANPAAAATAAPADALEWSQTLCGGKRVDFADAEKAAADLGEGWRLPTRKELDALLDFSRCDPAIDIGRFPETKSEPYWTSTPCAWNTSAVWVVGFDGGLAYVSPRYDSACVRAVRSSPAGQ